MSPTYAWIGIVALIAVAGLLIWLVRRGTEKEIINELKEEIASTARYTSGSYTVKMSWKDKPPFDLTLEYDHEPTDAEIEADVRAKAVGLSPEDLDMIVKLFLSSRGLLRVL